MIFLGKHIGRISVCFHIRSFYILIENVTVMCHKCNQIYIYFDLILLNLNLSLIENTVDPDQLASDKAICSGSTLFSTLIGNTYLQLEC